LGEYGHKGRNDTLTALEKRKAGTLALAFRGGVDLYPFLLPWDVDIWDHKRSGLEKDVWR
jgi:hypothetical protein